jgi:hypothetical protein
MTRDPLAENGHRDPKQFIVSELIHSKQHHNINPFLV